MNEASSGDQRRTVRRRPKRRTRFGIGVVLVGALWLLGDGLGWFGTAPAGGADDRARTSIRPGAPTSSSSAARTSPVPGAGSSEVPREPEAASSAETPATDVAPTPLDRDRFESLISRVQLHLDQDAWGRAAGVLARLAPLVQPHVGARARVRRWEEELQRAVRVAESRVVGLVAAGDVLEADEVALALSQEGAWRPGYAVADAARLGADWSRAPAQTELPEAAPMERRRPVRMRWEGRWRDGSVARSSSEQVTVHLTTDAGQRFPTVPRVALQPIDSTTAEAIEMGLAAANTGAPRLARLWLLRAVLLGGELGPRGVALRTALTPE